MGDESVALVDALFDASPIGMAIFDASFRFVRINRRLAEHNGFPVDHHIGRELREVLPALAPLLEPILARVLETGEEVRDIPVAGETPLQPGTIRQWRGTYLPIEANGGRAVAAYIEEHTEQLVVEQSLRASELRFRTITETAPLGIFLTSPDGNVVYANPAAQRILGRSAEELIRDGWGPAVHPDDLPEIRETVAAAYRVQLPDFEFRARVVRPNGELVWTESRSLQLFDGRTRMGRVTLMNDVTERQRIQSALHESEWLFRELSENVNAVFYLARPDESGVDYVSPGFRKIWGRDPQELHDNPGLWLEAIHPDDRERVLETFQRDRAGFHAEYRVVRPDGSVRWISDRSFPVRNEEGAVVRIAGVATDETERHALESQLLQAQRLESVGRLAGGVAHDFNNLLTVIMGHAAFARQDLPNAGEDLSAIEQAGRRAAELTAQLLAFARRQVVEPKVVDLNSLTSQIDRMLRRLIGEDVTLENVLHPTLWPVRVDPAQMEQVLVNLAVNARDAMPNGGRLTLETSNVVLDEGYVARHADVKPGDYVMLAVSDTGSGIDAALLPMIFEPFFTTKPSGTGTGLGLATCYGIVKQAGGHIWAYSEPGNGATFKVYLPRVRGEVAVEPSPVPSAEEPRGTETLLLVEDDAEVRAIAVRALRAHGFHVLQAVDGVEALQVVHEYAGAIDLLLTDVVMPRIGGKELSVQLTKARPGLRVLFASGYTRNAIVHQGVLEQGTNFLQKPYVPAALVKKVREVLDEEV